MTTLGLAAFALAPLATSLGLAAGEFVVLRGGVLVELKLDPAGNLCRLEDNER